MCRNCLIIILKIGCLLTFISNALIIQSSFLASYSAKKSNNDLASAVTTTENLPLSIFPENRTSENIVDRVGQTDQVKSSKSSQINEASPYSTKTNKKVYSRDVCNAKESEGLSIIMDFFLF